MNRLETQIDSPRFDKRLLGALSSTLDKYSGVDLYLTGGTSVALYSGVNRPLSLDLDFLIDASDEERVVELSGGEFEYFAGKKLFKSRKLVSKTGEVDLDFISAQNIVPDEDHPELRITVALTDSVRDRAFKFDMDGRSVNVLPPEYVLVAKLFAGRGIELGKYDLRDSASLLEVEGLLTADDFKQAILELASGDSEVLELMKSRLKDSLTEIVLPLASEFAESLDGLDVDEMRDELSDEVNEIL